jgi:hypothetical protein
MTCGYAHLAPNHELAAVERLCEARHSTLRATGEPTDTRTSTTPNELSRGDTTVLH